LLVLVATVIWSTNNHPLNIISQARFSTNFLRVDWDGVDWDGEWERGDDPFAKWEIRICAIR
jgi:hypothetical protein